MLPSVSPRLRAALAPPRYLAPPLSGIDVSASGVKVARLIETSHGLVLDQYAQVRLPLGVFVEGEIADRALMISAIQQACSAAGISSANVSLPESKSYLFEAAVLGATKAEWRTGVEQRLGELVPLPPEETVFDVVGVGPGDAGNQMLVGVGFARRMIDETLSVFDEAGVGVRALEEETFAMARALLPKEEGGTVVIIDLGKTTTKLTIVSSAVPRFSTTIGIGGHALTLAVQKHFGVTEEEARKVKSQRGIMPMAGNEEYLEAMLSTVSAIRDEIALRLQYWQERSGPGKPHQPVSRAILSGGNASIRGLPEYFEGALGIPVTAGDVFTNLAPRDVWVPALDYTESLAYATAIGLALRSRTYG
jgi:type IV pilus assembly protein PilM